jgi:hypothetical protein
VKFWLALIVSHVAATQSGFAPVVVNHRPTEQEQTKGNAIKSETLCKQRGGNWIGTKGSEYCVLPYPDAGKACKSSKECEGHCVASVSNDRMAPTPNQGTCQVNDDPDDCGRPHFEDGKVIYFNCD